jgi:hypothetical protein
MPFELIPSLLDFFHGSEQPHVLVAGLAQDLPQQPDAILLRTSEAFAKVTHRHRLVPKEVGIDSSRERSVVKATPGATATSFIRPLSNKVLKGRQSYGFFRHVSKFSRVSNSPAALDLNAAIKCLSSCSTN